MYNGLTRVGGFVLTWVMIAIVMIACQPIRAEVAPVAPALAEEQFVQTAMALEEAYQNEDLETVLAFYADDAQSYAPGFPADVGKDALRIAYQSYFDTYDLTRDFEITNVKLNGDYATRTAEWTQHLTPTDGSEPIMEVGRCVLGWEKINGEWKVVWEIWNTYETPAAQ